MEVVVGGGVSRGVSGHVTIAVSDWRRTSPAVCEGRGSVGYMELWLSGIGVSVISATGSRDRCCIRAAS